MEYLWTKGLTPPAFPQLSGDCETDTLVIGGGMAGVLCALQLQEAGINCILVEGRRLGSGMTKGTTAVLSAQHDTLYQDFISKHGRNFAKGYLFANLRAVERFRVLSGRVNCDFEERPSVMYSLHQRETMRTEAAALRSLGFDAEFSPKVPFSLPVAGAVTFPGMAQFHPLKFLYGIAKDLPVYENTFVRKLDGTTAITDYGQIRAKHVIIATHYPFINRYGLYPIKLYQQRSFVIALKGGPDLGCTTVEDAPGGIYMRNYGQLLLVGGGDHRTGKKNGGFSVPRTFARQYFPEAKEVLAWGNQDCMSLDGIPYIGRYSPSMPHVYVASGFNEWGMTTSMVASELVVSMILGKRSPYEPIFTPQRSPFTKQLFSNIGNTVLDFLSPTTKRCSHLGCALKWNPEEHSWDCPCHGSRYTAEGKLINNPAMKDIHL